MDGDSSDDELGDGDFLGQLLRHTKAKVLVACARGLANSEMMKKSAEELIYDRSKGCPKHWTVLRFILELLTLKAKHSWSDISFNDLLRILAWLLSKPNKVPANTYRAKKLVSPFTMGVERIHACPNHCILYRGDTFKDLKNALYVPQVATKIMLNTMVMTIRIQPMLIKGRGTWRRIIVLPPLSQMTLL